MDAFLEDNASFVMFGRDHLAAIVGILVLTVLLPLVTGRRLSLRQHRTCGFVVALAISAVVVLWTVLTLSLGVYDWKEDLPIHLCYLLALTLPVFAWKPDKWSHELLYYLTLSGTVQALITPRLTETFPHYDYWYYWIAHGGLLVYVIYVTVRQRLRPTFRGIWRTLLWINVYAVPVYLLNLALGSNYFYLIHKPDTASILDYMGPWPWYIFAAEGLAVVLFFLAYVPFAFIKRRR